MTIRSTVWFGLLSVVMSAAEVGAQLVPAARSATLHSRILAEDRTVFVAVPTTYRLLGSLGDVKAHYSLLGTRLGVAFEPPEEIVNELAIRYLETDSVDLAVATLRFNVDQHRESADAWRRLGIGLERSGHRREALESYRKAVALAERQRLPNLQMFRQHAARLATQR